MWSANSFEVTTAQIVVDENRMEVPMQTKGKRSDKTIWVLVGLAASLLVPSIGQVHKYVGNGGIVLYLVLGSATVVAGYRYIWPVYLRYMTSAVALLLAILTFIGFAAGLDIVYPLADSGFVGGGVDRDDGLNIVASALLNGHYPYYYKILGGAPISPMPGAIVLSTPFVAMGSCAWQNLFWLFLLFVVTSWYFQDLRNGLLLFWAISGLSPIVLQEYLTGGDILANSIYVLLFTWLFFTCISRQGTPTWGKLLSAVLFGIGLSSRANFLLIVPPVFSILVQKTEWKSALKWMSLALLSFCLMTGPFYLYSPEVFSSCLNQQASWLARYDSLLPHAEIVIPLVAGLLSIGLSFQKMNLAKLFRNCAIIQAVPILSGAVLSIVYAGMSKCTLRIGYGLMFLFFGALSSWIFLNDDTRTRLPRAGGSDSGLNCKGDYSAPANLDR